MILFGKALPIYIGHLRAVKLELLLKHQGEEEMIAYLNTLCVPAITMGVVKFRKIADSWSNYHPSVDLALLCFAGVCMGNIKKQNKTKNPTFREAREFTRAFLTFKKLFILLYVMCFA